MYILVGGLPRWTMRSNYPSSTSNIIWWRAAVNEKNRCRAGGRDETHGRRGEERHERGHRWTRRREGGMGWRAGQIDHGKKTKTQGVWVERPKLGGVSALPRPCQALTPRMLPLHALPQLCHRRLLRRRQQQPAPTKADCQAFAPTLTLNPKKHN